MIMAFQFDLITIINLLMCAMIALLGIWAFQKTRDRIPLYIGIAFALLGLVYFIKIIGVGTPIFIAFITVVAYLLVMFTMYRIIFK